MEHVRLLIGSESSVVIFSSFSEFYAYMYMLLGLLVSNFSLFSPSHDSRSSNLQVRGWIFPGSGFHCCAGRRVHPPASLVPRLLVTEG